MKREQSRPLRLGRYELVEAVASGGMGQVYRARAYAAAGVTKEVCVKRIRAERLDDPSAVVRFIAEARLSMNLSHANIVPVFDFGRADDGYFLAMEWVDGADLRSVLQGGPLTAAVAAYVGAAVARGLAYAHDPDGAATVHRDVKPANVLIARSGDVKLADFGVAALVGSDRGVAGTAAYMAPEQREGAQPTPGADLYSLGVMLQKMTEDAPPALGEILDQLIDEDPESRAKDADLIAEALEAFIARERVGGAPSPRTTLRKRVGDVKPVSAPVSDVLGADLSFVRDGMDATFSTRMGASMPTAPAKPPAKRKLGRWATGLVLAMGALLVAWAQSQPARDAPGTRERTPAPTVRADPTVTTMTSITAMTPTTPTVMAPTVIAPTVMAPTVMAPRMMTSMAPTVMAPVAMGTLNVNAVPWAHVFVDGRRIGETPLLGFRLPVGPHTLRLQNEPLDVTREMRVTISPDAPLRVVVRLDE